LLTMWLRNVLTIRESLVWDRRFGWFLVVINSVSSRESTCNIAGCIATSSPSSPRYYAPPLSTPLIPRRRHERSTAPPLPPSSMPSVFLDIKGGMPTVSQSSGQRPQLGRRVGQGRRNGGLPSLNFGGRSAVPSEESFVGVIIYRWKSLAFVCFSFVPN